MTDKAIQAAVGSGAIQIDPPPADIKAASVDFRLGPEAFLGTGSEIIDLEERRLLSIAPGELVLVTTYEKVRVGPRFAGQIGLRSFYARKGLALLAGPQIDPGFRGRLHLALVNLSPVELSIAYKEPLITVGFHDLGEEVDRPYGQGSGDEFNEQDKITGSEIDDIRQHRGYAMSEVIREMATLSANVGELRSSVDGYIKTADVVMKRTDIYMRVFVGTTVTLVLTIVGVLISHAA
jgi:dCTP deaminase